MVKEGVNQGRPIRFCPKAKEDSTNCQFVHMLPLCHCGKAAGVAFKDSGEAYYRCGALRDFCSFKDWNGPGAGRGGEGRSALHGGASVSAEEGGAAPKRQRI